MHMFDLFNPAALEDAVNARLVRDKPHPGGHDLRILNYTDAALYTPGAWDNPAVRVCRGLIVTTGGMVVARPWAKFFNHNQTEAGDLDYAAHVEVTDKMDGSLGIIYAVPDGTLQVATRGSFASDQAVTATRMLHDLGYADTLTVDRVTPLVEIVYPENRIVCDYNGMTDLILLGGVNIGTGAYYSPLETTLRTGWVGPRTTVFEADTLADALRIPPRAGAEGLCVRFVGASKIVKIKQADYVALHKIVTGLSERSVWENMVAGWSLAECLTGIPDELHPWVRATWDTLVANAEELAARVEATHATIVGGLPAGWSRGDYARHAKIHPELTPWLFLALDGRDPRPRILATLKPAADTKPRTFSEETA